MQALGRRDESSPPSRAGFLPKVREVPRVRAIFSYGALSIFLELRPGTLAGLPSPRWCQALSSFRLVCTRQARPSIFTQITGRQKTPGRGQNGQIAAFSFFTFYCCFEWRFLKEENSRHCCQALFTRGEGKGRRRPSSLLTVSSAAPDAHRARTDLFQNFSWAAPPSAHSRPERRLLPAPTMLTWGSAAGPPGGAARKWRPPRPLSPRPRRSPQAGSARPAQLPRL